MRSGKKASRAPCESNLPMIANRSALILKEPQDMPFGVRQYTAKDIGGHWRTFSENIRDVDPAEWGAKVAP